MTVLKIFALATLILVSVYLILDGISIGFAVRNSMKTKVPYQKTLTLEFLSIFLWGICLAILIYS
jgi:hypothetical protein